MGDADCTYDFRKLGAVRRARSARATSSSWARAGRARSRRARCRALHQYFGTPGHDLDPQPRSTAAKFSDIHCGMRGHHPRRARAHGPQSRSRGSTPRRWCSSRCTWSCARPRCRSRFLKDREGRLSATTSGRAGSRRSQAAWINLRAMFVYGAEFFLFKPGHRAARARPAAHRCRWRSAPITIGAVTFCLYWMLLGADARRGRPAEHLLRLPGPGASSTTPGDDDERWRRAVPLHARPWSPAPALFALGVAARRCRWSCTTSATGSRLPTAADRRDHLAVTGLLLMIIGFSHVLLHAAAARDAASATAPSDDRAMTATSRATLVRAGRRR